MACPTPGIIAACDFPQFLVDQTPKFDEIIMEDIRPTDGWLYNVSTGFVPTGTPSEVTQDRFRSVWPNTTKQWTRVASNGPGCSGNPCDPTEHSIGWGADRLTWYEEQQYWQTPLLCYDSNIQVTHAEEHLDQIISKVLKPATIAISSNFLRKRHLLWSKIRSVANANCSSLGTDGVFTYQWGIGGINGDEEIYLETNANPNRVFKLVPQMLQNRFTPLMLKGYAGENPFKETSPFIELVTDINTCWDLEHLGGQVGIGGGNDPTVLGNWRFTSFDESTKYWRYGFSGQIGNFMTRVDPMQLRFNYVGDMGAAWNGSNGNRYRYEVVLPFHNVITTGAGGAAGLGSDVNGAYDRARFSFSQIHHKAGMELLTREASPLSSELPFGHRDFGGKWQFAMHDLGADQAGNVINNKRQNKGQFIADFRYFIRPKHYEFLETFFHAREQFCVPEISPCSPMVTEGYPTQCYSSELPSCIEPDGGVPVAFTNLYAANGIFPVPHGTQDGPVPAPSSVCPPENTPLLQ
jgi:hypothetical protein